MAVQMSRKGGEDLLTGKNPGMNDYYNKRQDVPYKVKIIWEQSFEITNFIIGGSDDLLYSRAV